MASSLTGLLSSRPLAAPAAAGRRGAGEDARRSDGGPRATHPARTAPAVALALALPLAGSAMTPAAAQDDGTVHVEGGVSHSLAPSGSPADPSTYGVAGLRLDWAAGPRSRFFGSAYGGLGFEDAAGNWGSVSLGFDLWTPAGDLLVLGLAGRGEAFTVAPPFEYRAVEGELRPSVALRFGDVWLALQGRGGVGVSEARTHDDPSLPAGLSPTGEVTTDLWYWGGGPEVTVPAGPVDLTVGAHAYDARVGTYGRARAGVTGEAGPLEVSLDLGVWDTPGDSEVTGGLAVRVPVGDGAAVHTTVRRARPDPLLGTPASGQGSLTGSARIARLGSPGDRPLYSVDRTDGAAEATVTFVLRRPEAGEVEVLGDFSGWAPVPMERRDGAWTAEIGVEPGVHHFGFRVDGEWFVPADAPGRTPDDWGRVNATLVVPR